MVQKSCRVEVVLLSGGCCFFFSPDFFWSRNHSREEVWPPWKTNMAMKDPTIWRCTSYEKIMMFHSHVSFPGCSGVTILLEKPNRKKHKNQKNTSISTHPCNFNPTFTDAINDKRWLADGPMEKSRSIFVNHKPLGKVTKCLDFQVWKKTTDLKPLTDFRLPPQPLRISGHDNEEGFFTGKNSTKISCFDIFTSRNHRGSVGPWKLNCNPAIRRPGQTRRLHCGSFWSGTVLGYVVLFFPQSFRWKERLIHLSFQWCRLFCRLFTTLKKISLRSQGEASPS